jgi:hypothetical protein
MTFLQTTFVQKKFVEIRNFLPKTYKPGLRQGTLTEGEEGSVWLNSSP